MIIFVKCTMESSSGPKLNFRKYIEHIPGLFIFFLLPLVYFHSTQDPEQMPRLTALSAFLILGSVVFLFSKKAIALSGNVIVLNFLLAAMLVWTGSGMYFSVNAGDAFSEWMRLVVLFCFFFFVNQLIAISPAGIIRMTCRYVAIGIFIFTAFAIAEVIEGIRNNNGLPYKIENLISSLFTNKNFFSECLVLMLPFLIYGFRSDRLKGIYIAAIILNLTMVFILKSSAAWAALFIAAVTYLIVIYSNIFSTKKIILGCGLIFVCGIAIIYLTKDKFVLTNKIAYAIEYLRNPDLISVTRKENNNSTYERMMLWRNTLSMIADHPVTGVGLNNWKIYNPSYGIGGTQYTNTGMIVYEHPHNDYLLLLAEQGPVGLILYLIFIGYVLIIGIRIFRSVNENQKFFIALLICSIIAYATISLFSYPRSRVYQTVLLLLTIAVLFSYSKSEIKIYSEKSFLFILLFSLIGLYVFSSRTLSEIHARSMVYAQVHKNFPRMQREASEADSWLFPVDMSATPIHWYLGMARFYENDIEGAKKEYEEAMKINPYHLRTINDLATTYERTGHTAEAIALYRRGLNISPQFVEGNMNISAAYFNSGNIDSAYYFINRIKGLEMSLAEQSNYKTFSQVINQTYDSLQQNKNSQILNEK